MAQNIAASVKTGETKGEEQKSAAVPGSSANNKSNKFLQLDTQKLKLVSDTVKVSVITSLFNAFFVNLHVFLSHFPAKSQK